MAEYNIPEKLDKLEEDIIDAYKMVRTKGGYFMKNAYDEDECNTNNLPSAISTIPTERIPTEGIELYVVMQKAGTLSLSTSSSRPSYAAYTIDWGDGTITTNGSYTHAYAMAGDYTVIVSNTDGSDIESVPAYFIYTPSGGIIKGFHIPETVKSLVGHAIDMNNVGNGLCNLDIDLGDGLETSGNYGLSLSSGFGCIKVGKSFLGGTGALALHQIGGHDIYFNAVNCNDSFKSYPVFTSSRSITNPIKITIGKDCTKLPEYFYGRPSTSYNMQGVSTLEFETDDDGNCALTTIGAYAFASPLENNETSYPLYAMAQPVFKLPKSVTKVGTYAFRCMWWNNKQDGVLDLSEGAVSFVGATGPFEANRCATVKIGKDFIGGGLVPFYNMDSVKDIYWNAKSATQADNNRGYFTINRGINNGGLPVRIHIGADVEEIPADTFRTGATNGSTSDNEAGHTPDFSECTDKLKKIGDKAFYNAYANSSRCTGGEQWQLPDSVEYIGIWAFERTFNAAPIFKMPKRCAYIGKGAFRAINDDGTNGQNKLEGRRDLIIDPDVECEIGDYAFDQNYETATQGGSIYIGKNVKKIGYQVFSNNQYCDNFTWDAEDCEYVGSTALSDSASILGSSTLCTTGAGTFKIGENCKKIPSWLLAYNNSESTNRANIYLDLTEAENLEEVGRSAFARHGYDAYYMSSASAVITLPKLKKLDIYAFCRAMAWVQELHLPSVEDLSNQCLYGFGRGLWNGSDLYIGDKEGGTILNTCTIPIHGSKIRKLYWNVVSIELSWTSTSDCMFASMTQRPKRIIVGKDVEMLHRGLFATGTSSSTYTTHFKVESTKLKEIHSYAFSDVYLESIYPTGYSYPLIETFPTTLNLIKASAFNIYTTKYALRYAGTMAQWNAITKEDGWKKSGTTVYVECTDGTLTY